MGNNIATFLEQKSDFFFTLKSSDFFFFFKVPFFFQFSAPNQFKKIIITSMLTHENVAKNLSTSDLLCSPQLCNWGHTNKGREWCYRGGHQRTCYKCKTGKAPIATLYFLNQHFCHSVDYSNWVIFFLWGVLLFTIPVNIVELLLFFHEIVWLFQYK